MNLSVTFFESRKSKLRLSSSGFSAISITDVEELLEGSVDETSYVSDADFVEAVAFRVRLIEGIPITKAK